MSSEIPRCKTNHAPSWIVVYDIGKNKTEEILVCNNCFDNPQNDCFRLFVISKKSIHREVN